MVVHWAAQLTRHLKLAGNENYAKFFDAPKPVGGPDVMAGWADLKMLRIVNKPDIVPTVSQCPCLALVCLSRALRHADVSRLIAPYAKPWHLMAKPSRLPNINIVRRPLFSITDMFGCV